MVWLLGHAAVLVPIDASTPQAALCAHVELQAELDPSLQLITGTLACHARTTGILWLARYPALLTDDSAHDELTARRVYPEGFDHARMDIEGPRVGPGAHDGKEPVWQSFGPVRAGDVLRVRFRTRVPERLGTLGAHGGMAVLLGGWHPVVGSGPGLRPTVQQLPIHYRITVPERLAGFVGVHPFGRRSARARQGHHQGSMVPMLVAPALHVHAYEGGLLVAPKPRHPTVHGSGDISVATDEKAHQEALWTAAMGAGFVQQALTWAQGEALAPPPASRPPLLVVVPLRDRLSEAFDGGVALSDRAFHLLPFETLLRFHRASLWREQFRVALMPILGRKTSVWPTEVLADATAAALSDRMLAATGTLAYAPELLEKFSASPAVDQLIFAPQIPFPEVFYDAVDESRLRSVRFDSLLAPLPRGKIIYEKLRDFVGRPAALRILLENVPENAGPLEERLQNHLGPAQAASIMAWLGPYPDLDYALTGIDSQPTHTHAVVALTGPDAARIVEPVTVAVTDKHHQVHHKMRLGPGPIDFDVPGPARVIEVDPGQRLVEKCHPPRRQARFNNREPKRYRLLLNDLSATLDVSGRALTAAFDLLGRRIYDLRRDMHLGGTFGPYTYGAQAGYSEHFGRELTPLKLAHTVSVNAAWSRLRGISGSTSPPGQLATLGLAYRYDTRLSRLMALRGTGLDAVATVGLTTLSGVPRSKPWLLLGVSGLKIVPLWRRQALLLRLRYDALVGEAPPQSQLRLGGRYLGARGFQIAEAYGEHRLLASMELRHVLMGDSRTDVAGLITLTSVEGALFADGVHMPGIRPRSYGTVLGDVGYGLRLMGDVLGISPATLALDIALPLGHRAGGLAPVTIYVAFVQSFLAF